MNIITVTLNPAFDIHCYVECFLSEHENLAEITHRDAGGKGLNISKALTANDIENIALLVLGEDNATDFCQLLNKTSVHTKNILVPGRIRENITIHSDKKDETRLSFRGFSADNNLLNKVFKQINDIIEKEDIITFTGRIPSGMDMASVQSFLSKLNEKGVKLVIDSRSFELQDIIQAKPWLIKPNQEEISHYFSREIDSVTEAVTCARSIQRNGVQNVMISLGEKGAVLVCDNGVFFASAPPIKAISTIGAGDSAIAGFLSATVNNGSSEDCLKSAVAFGSAACLQSGTMPPRKTDVNLLIDAVQVVSI